jgi:hypothetical protein
MNVNPRFVFLNSVGLASSLNMALKNRTRAVRLECSRSMCPDTTNYKKTPKRGRLVGLRRMQPTSFSAARLT